MKKISFILGLLLVILWTAQCDKDDDKDTTIPVIELKGSNPMLVDKGSTFVDPGAVATDETDGDISDKIEISGHVDTQILGEYELTYNVKDAAGNFAIEKKRKVEVMIF